MAHRMTTASSAINCEWLPHRALEVESLDIVPVLLEQGDKEVDGHKRVLPQFIWVHVDVPDRNAHAENLFQLKLHLASNLGDLGLKVVTVLNECGELARFVQARTQKTWDLRDKDLGCQKGIETLSKLLHELLVFVQLFQVLHAL